MDLTSHPAGENQAEPALAAEPADP